MSKQHLGRRRSAILAALLALVSVATSCGYLLERAVETAIEEAAGVEVEHLSDEPLDFHSPALRGRLAEPGPVTSIYQTGPTLDWNRSLRPNPAASSTAFYQSRFFGGRCPALLLGSSSEDDSFSRAWRSEDVRLEPRGLGLHPDLEHFRYLTRGPRGALSFGWQYADVLGQSSGACGFREIPLLTIGAQEPSILHR